MKFNDRLPDMDNNLYNTLIDNSEDLKLADIIKKILKNTKLTNVDIATGYWDIPGMSLIADELDSFLARDNTKLRILIGKDPFFMVQYNANPKYKDIKFPEEYIKTDINEIEVIPEYENAVAFLLKYLNKKNKIEIHIYKKNKNDEVQFLHSKCYIFIANNESYGIIGSSNFTLKGLQGNAELNYLETHGQIVMASPTKGSAAKGHAFWFNEMWNLSSDWTQEFLEQILKPSVIGKKIHEEYQQDKEVFIVLSPYQTYIKLLMDQFGELIDFDGKIKPDDYMPHDPDFKKLIYQSEAVNQGFAIMKRHNGFILADVVGLGKTFTALMVVKRYLLEFGFKNNILIISPPAIKQSWIDSIKYFDKNELNEKKIESQISITTIGCLEDVTDYIGNDDFDGEFLSKQFGMIVIDESHRFRNNRTAMYQKLDSLIGSTAPTPYLVLLSATPQNNRPEDLKNQIYLFQREHNNSTLQNLGKHGNKLENYFAEKQRNYEEYIKKDKKINGKKIPKSKDEIAQDRQNLIADSKDIRKRIVEPLIVRRTRTDIEKYYEDDMRSQGLSFPKIEEPKAIPYDMKGDLACLFNDTINIIAPQVSKVDCDEDGNPIFNFGTVEGEDGLGYYRYRAIEFLNTEELRKHYEINNLTVQDTSERLAQLMEILLVKRLESSQAAFKESLHNLIRYTQNMIKMWDANRIFICPDLDVNKEFNSFSLETDEDINKCLNIIAEKSKRANKKRTGSEDMGPNREYKRTNFDSRYIDLLNNDLVLIKNLYNQWSVQTNDPKMDTFIRKLDSEFFEKNKNPFQKLVVFTECIATQKNLVQKLEGCAAEFNVLSITAENREKMKDIVAANFDANFKGEKKNDYHILITTDVLSEGVNLHRSNSILNYDSPWNATRLMQRLGRINRIGTEAKTIYSYNFYPSSLGDGQINLKNRTYVKLQAFHELFGEDSRIFSPQEEVRHFPKFKLIEDFENQESPIMPFIGELKKFKKDNPDDYDKLKNIKSTVVSFIKDNIYKKFSCLHENDIDNRLIQSILYLNKEGETKQVGQLEFFETLRPFIDSNQKSGYVNSEKIAIYKKEVMDCYEKDKQNAAISLKSKIKIGKKDQNQAIKKIQDLYRHEISSYFRDMLDEISNSVRSFNDSLIKKVLETDFSDKFLFENNIQRLYKIIQPVQRVMKIELPIILIAE